MANDERYSRGKIYKLVSDMTDLIYIGSCCKPLSKRLCAHKSDFKLGKARTKSVELFKLGGKVEIILIEDYPCKSKWELERRERYHIEHNICVNKFKPARTNEERLNQMKEYYKEYYEANIEAISEKAKQYHEVNRDVILEKKKEYREVNRDVILEKAKEYYQANHDTIIEKQKQYKEANRDVISQKNKERVKCPHCQKEMNRSSLRQHIKTQHPDV
jgi:hypothetical protein